MKTAQNLVKIKTKKELIAVALESFIKELRRKEMLKSEGKIKWDGNLDEIRRA